MKARRLWLMTWMAIAAPLNMSAQAPAGPVGAFGAALNGLQLRAGSSASRAGRPESPAYIVSLRARSVYTVRISLGDYTRRVETTLPSGHYKIAAQFLGRRANGVNLDMQGVALLNFWTGTAHSNIAEFAVSQ